MGEAAESRLTQLPGENRFVTRGFTSAIARRDRAVQEGVWRGVPGACGEHTKPPQNHGTSALARLEAATK